MSGQPVLVRCLFGLDTVLLGGTVSNKIRCREVGVVYFGLSHAVPDEVNVKIMRYTEVK